MALNSSVLCGGKPFEFIRSDELEQLSVLYQQGVKAVRGISVQQYHFHNRGGKLPVCWALLKPFFHVLALFAHMPLPS